MSKKGGNPNLFEKRIEGINHIRNDGNKIEHSQDPTIRL